MTDDEILQRFKNINAIDNTKYPLNDVGAARLFTDVFSECMYNTTEKNWNYFDGKRIIKDAEGLHALNCAKLIWKLLPKYIYQKKLTDEERINYQKYIFKWSDANYRRKIVTDARSNRFIDDSMLDNDGYLLNCQNGSLILKNNNISFVPHSIDNLCSKLANVKYDEKADCPLWLKFMNDIMQGDKEKIVYLQKMLGLCLTGETQREEMYFLYGSSTRNGKSTFTETISYILGDYSVTMNPDSLAIKQFQDGSKANGDIARLNSARMIIMPEPRKNLNLDVALIKILTGNDIITARHLHQSEIQFRIIGKILCNTNYLPVVTDNTFFKSGRVKVITFDRHFESHEQDRTLKMRLRKESSGILNWLIEGLKLYYKEGLEPPQAVINATDDYASASDKVQNFIDDCLTRSERNISIADAYRLYETWCRSNGLGVDGKPNFIKDIKSKNLWRATATVKGKTVRGAIIGFVANDEGFETAGELPFN